MNISTYSQLQEYSYEYTGSTAIYENIPMNISTGSYEYFYEYWYIQLSTRIFL